MNFLESILQKVQLDVLGRICRFEIQRDDLLHPIVSGNKWRKLEGWVNLYNSENYEGILTFGGAFSNHLLATAAYGFNVNIPTLGIVRGEEGFDNHYLSYCKYVGMELHYVTRVDYRDKTMCSNRILEGRNYLVIPEGGSGFAGLKGFEVLVNSWTFEPDVVVCASATGTTALGLSSALLKRGWKTRVKAVLVLKNLEEQMQFWEKFPALSSLIDPVMGYDFGGYAKTTPELIQFIQNVQTQVDFPIDPVYVAKGLFALWNQTEWSNLRTIYLHTGGQWGRDSERFKALL
jgi:1-aminocyclopropane-1-carboxylate deaminase